MCVRGLEGIRANVGSPDGGVETHMSDGRGRGRSRSRIRSLSILALGAAALAVVAVAVREAREPKRPFARLGSSESPHEPTSSRSNQHPPNKAWVVLIVMENHEYSDIVGSADAPYVNQSLIPGGKLFTNYDAVSHPSLPNYLAMTSGSTGGKQGTDSVSAGEIAADNLFGQLSTAGIDWRAFEEAMPSACFKPYSAGSSPNSYELKHDPAMTYADIADTSLCRQVVPYSWLDPSHLPPFSFVTPDECNDMHSCPAQAGDAWLARNIPPLLRAGAIVIVTFDEGSTDAGGGGHVLLVEVGDGVPAGSREDRPFDHYGLLAGLETYFGLPRLGAAGTAAPFPIPPVAHPRG